MSEFFALFLFSVVFFVDLKKRRMMSPLSVESRTSIFSFVKKSSSFLLYKQLLLLSCVLVTFILFLYLHCIFLGMLDFKYLLILIFMKNCHNEKCISQMNFWGWEESFILAYRLLCTIKGWQWRGSRQEYILRNHGRILLWSQLKLHSNLNIFSFLTITGFIYVAMKLALLFKDKHLSPYFSVGNYKQNHKHK